MRLFLILFLSFLFSFPSLASDRVKEVLNWGVRREVVKECLKYGVDPRVVVAIRWIESYKKNGVVYPYVVRVNSGLSKLKGVRFAGVERVSNHVFVCSSKESCISFVKTLISLGVKNFDAGLYQINYLHNGNKFKNFPLDVFDRVKSGKFVCRHVGEYLRKYGFNSNAVALYHSFTEDKNEKYAEKFYSVYSRLKFQGIRRISVESP